MSDNYIKVNLVIDYIILRLCEEGKFINLLKLQKLLYYVQAWHLVHFNRKLFRDDFQAWVHGPVCRTVYDRFRSKMLYDCVSLDSIDNENPHENIPEDSLASINSVLDVYGSYSGNQLEDMTHNEIPWIEARGGLPMSSRCENIIKFETMKEYYSSLVK